MTKDGFPKNLGAGVEEVARAVEAARVAEAERLAAATLTVPPSTGNASYDTYNPKFFTSDDMEKALENQKREMETTFVKMKATTSESQTSSVRLHGPTSGLCVPRS